MRRPGLAVEEPAVVCLQALKAEPGRFPDGVLAQLGDHATWRGQRIWKRGGDPGARGQTLVICTPCPAIPIRLGALDANALGAGRAAVQAAKLGLADRRPVWWDDGAPDLNRRLVRNTACAAGYSDRGDA